MQWPQILAQAVVDPGRFAVESVELQAFLVTVNGRVMDGDDLPRRKYEIAAINEDVAARAGLQRYVDEFERLN